MRRPPPFVTPLRAFKGSLSIFSNEERKVSRKSHLPENPIFTIDAEEIAAASGLDGDVAARQWEAFVAYYRARGTQFADWGAAWRKWCLNYKPHYDKASFQRDVDEHLAEFADTLANTLPAPLAITETGYTAGDMLTAIKDCKLEVEFRERQLLEFDKALSAAKTESEGEEAAAKVAHAKGKIAAANLKMANVQQKRRAT